MVISELISSFLCPTIPDFCSEPHVFLIYSIEEQLDTGEADTVLRFSPVTGIGPTLACLPLRMKLVES